MGRYVNIPGKCHSSFPDNSHLARKKLAKTSPGCQDEASNPGAGPLLRLRAIFSSFALEGIEAVLVDVFVDGDRSNVVEPQTDCDVSSVGLGMTL